MRRFSLEKTPEWRLNNWSGKSLDNEKLIDNEVSRTRDVSQWESIRVESRFQERIYIIPNIIRKFICQMINYLLFQAVK